MANNYDGIKDEQVRVSLIKKQQIYSFAKFFLGTFVLGILGYYVNLEIHVGQLNLQKLEHQNDQVASYLGQFMHGGNKEQLAFANFLRFSSLEVDERARYSELFQYLKTQSDNLVVAAEENYAEEIETQALVSIKILEREEIQRQLSLARGNDDLMRQLKQKKMEIEAAKLQLAKIHDKEEEIAVKMSSPVQDEIELDPIEVGDVVIPVEREEFTKSGWSIDGRYMQFGQIRVLVVDPSRTRGRATLKVYFIEENKKKVLIGTSRLKSGESCHLEYETESHKYDLTLKLDDVSKYYGIRSKAEWTLTQKKSRSN